MNRIKPEEVLNAFKELDMVGAPGLYVDIKHKEKEAIHCACGLGIMYMKELDYKKEDTRLVIDLDDNESAISHYFDNKYPEAYRVGFVNGFDAEIQHSHSNYLNNEAYDNGYEDGKNSRELLIKEGLFFT